MARMSFSVENFTVKFLHRHSRKKLIIFFNRMQNNLITDLLTQIGALKTCANNNALLIMLRANDDLA